MPPMRALQAFEAFGRLGSVTGAARELGVSVGAVSQQLRKAEESVGIRLLERRGRSVELSFWGRQYHADLEAGFGLIRAAQDNIARSQFKSALTISCLPSLAGKWLGSLLLDWQAKHNRATVLLIGDDAEPELGSGLVDFRISYGSKIQQYEHTAELFTDSAVPACSPAFLAKHPVSRPQDILGLPLLGINWARDHGAPPGWSDWAASVGADYRRKPGEVNFTLSSAAIDAAMNSKGFVLAQLSMAAEDMASGRLVVPFDNPIRLPASYFLAWSRAALEKPHGRELRTWLLAIARQHRGP